MFFSDFSLEIKKKQCLKLLYKACSSIGLGFFNPTSQLRCTNILLSALSLDDVMSHNDLTTTVLNWLKCVQLKTVQKLLASQIWSLSRFRILNGLNAEGLCVHISSKGWCYFFPLPSPLFQSQVGHSDQTGSFSLVPKNELHASWRHNGVILQGG